MPSKLTKLFKRESKVPLTNDNITPYQFAPARRQSTFPSGASAQAPQLDDRAAPSGMPDIGGLRIDPNPSSYVDVGREPSIYGAQQYNGGQQHHGGQQYNGNHQYNGMNGVNGLNRQSSVISPNPSFVDHQAPYHNRNTSYGSGPSPMASQATGFTAPQPRHAHSHREPPQRQPTQAQRPAQNSSQAVMPGNLPLYRAPGQIVTPEELRELREMIRLRYDLDNKIWRQRRLRERDRDVTRKDIRQADALMDKIRRTVISWDNPEFWDPHRSDYDTFREIKRRIIMPGKRNWTDHPPWEEPNSQTRTFS